MPPSTRSPIDTGRQQQRRLQGRLQDESAWLQRLLFALGKVEEARQKQATMHQESLPPLIVLDDGTPVPMHLVADGMRRRIDEVRKSLGEGHQGLPKGGLEASSA